MIRTIYFIFFVCICSLGLWACSDKPKEEYKNLSSAQFEELIQDKNIQLVDARTPAEYLEGHIKGSINLNVKDNDFSSTAEKLLNKEQAVAVYCRSGKRSRKAAGLLVKQGFKVVYNLDKGILQWKEEGREVVQ